MFMNAAVLFFGGILLSVILTPQKWCSVTAEFVTVIAALAFSMKVHSALE